MNFQTATIRQTLIHLKADGFYISENALRNWVRTGEIPATFCGTRAYLWYPNVIRFLQEGNSPPPVDSENREIRRIG